MHLNPSIWSCIQTLAVASSLWVIGSPARAQEPPQAGDVTFNASTLNYSSQGVVLEIPPGASLFNLAGGGVGVTAGNSMIVDFVVPGTNQPGIVDWANLPLVDPDQHLISDIFADAYGNTQYTESNDTSYTAGEYYAYYGPVYHTVTIQFSSISDEGVTGVSFSRIYAAPVPEPSSAILGALALAGLGSGAWRRRLMKCAACTFRGERR